MALGISRRLGAARRGVNSLPESCDLVVVGSGAGGLSAAVTAAHLGLDVVVVEKHAQFGGTTAWSGGWMWLPRNPLAVAAGIDEEIEEPRRYLQHLLGAHFDAARIDAFLAHAPAAVQFHLDHTALRFIDGNAVPDFHGNAPGARAGGRAVCAAPFDGRRLGAHLASLRAPHDLLSFLGMGIGGGADLRHFLRASRAPDSFFYVAKRIVRHAFDVLRHGRGSVLMGGNALAAALLKSALDRGVKLFASHGAMRLLVEGGRVVGAEIQTPNGARTIRARRGVVLAAGGFAHDAARQQSLHAEHASAAPPENTGDGLRLAEAASARIDVGAQAVAWAPVSLVPCRDGSAGVFPHLVERGKPGLIAVARDGQRFVNESGDYFSFMRALFAHCARQLPNEPVQAWLLADRRFQRRFGLGHSKPRPLPLGPSLRSGYLKRGDSIEELGRECGIDAGALLRTVTAYNVHAAAGHDPQFNRGATPYERIQGDAEHRGPNPCIAPIVQAPFYAVRVVPGSLGTFAGIATNEHAQALDAQGRAIDGLYACGNDMASAMGGHYPSGGITLGPALTFGYLLAHHAAGIAAPTTRRPT